MAPIPQPWIETPLVESAKLSKLAGCRVYLKLESLQPSGSFKSRGIGNLIRQAVLSHPPSTPLHFYSSSGGNAGIAAVTAASTLGYPSTVVVPLSTKPMMIEKIKLAGASEVIQEGATWFHADQFLVKSVIPQAESRGEIGVYVPPFDHQDIWDGASTLVDEIQVQLGQLVNRGGHQNASSGHEESAGDQKILPDVVVCSVGGGGLFCGLSQGLERYQAENGETNHRTQIIAVETEGAESLHKSIQAGELVTLSGITSLATTLGAIRVTPKALEYGLLPTTSSIVVSDKQAVNACRKFADEERILVEPSCGASLAVLYSDLLKSTLEKRSVDLNEETKVVVIVCGGVGVTLGLLEEWRETYSL